MHRLPGSRVASHRMRSLAQFWIMLYWIVRICACATLHRASVFFFCLLCRPLFPGRCSGARVRLCAFVLPKRFFVSRTCVWSAIVSTQGPPTARQPAYEAGSVCCVCVSVYKDRRTFERTELEDKAIRLSRSKHAIHNQWTYTD